MAAVHPLVHLAVLTPIIRVAANLQHILAGDILELVFTVERVTERHHSSDLVPVNGVLTLLQRAVNAPGALRVTCQHDFGVRALPVRFAGEHGHVRSARGSVFGVALGVGRVVYALDAERGNLIAQSLGQFGTDTGAHVAYFGGATGEDQGDVAADGVLHAEHEGASFRDVVVDVGRDEAGV